MYFVNTIIYADEMSIVAELKQFCICPEDATIQKNRIVVTLCFLERCRKIKSFELSHSTLYPCLLHQTFSYFLYLIVTGQLSNAS